MKALYGTGVALVTPFTESGDVDYPALKKILRHTARGVDYWVVMGTTGESVTCSKEEKKEILSFVRNHNPKGLPIVYGIGGNNTTSVLDEIDSTSFSGVAALLSVSPYYNKPAQEGIYQHFQAVAEFSPVPVILYNVPGRTASNLTAETTLRLAAHSNIIGIKEASGNLEQCLKIAARMPRNFMLISGDDMLTVPIYAIGGVGVISVLANAFPVIFKKMTDHAAAGNFPKATRELVKLTDINGLMYEEGNPAGIKYLLSLMGLCESHFRLPVVPPSDALQKKIQTALALMKK
jgi:4-hydroxy-tetrahydrodipicolinate synthase